MGGEMKERPILFSGPMVRAILEGRKTQTRRIVKDQDRFRSYEERTTDDGCFFITFDGYHGGGGESCTRAMLAERYCPHGAPGDRLWVRETWSQDGRGGVEPNGEEAVYYRADMVSEDIWQGFWRPSIYMPRWASRIDLEIEDVEVQRLHDISEDDVEREGICCAQCQNSGSIRTYDSDGYLVGDNCPSCTDSDTMKPKFETLWNSIHGKNAWDANPWVWVISFKQV